MTSQTDLDQGGTNRQMVRQYLGPSVGWVTTPAPGASLFPITAAGTYEIEHSVTLITIDYNGDGITITLPRAHTPTLPGPQALPGLFVQNPITIVDVGGHCYDHPVTIEPVDGTETVMGLASIPLATNYGGFSLKPNDELNGWVSIFP